MNYKYSTIVGLYPDVYLPARLLKTAITQPLCKLQDHYSTLNLINIQMYLMIKDIEIANKFHYYKPTLIS